MRQEISPSRVRRPCGLVPQRGHWLGAVGSIALTVACSGEVSDPSFDVAGAGSFAPGRAPSGGVVSPIVDGSGTPSGDGTGIPGTPTPGVLPIEPNPGSVENPPSAGSEPGTTESDSTDAEDTAYRLDELYAVTDFLRARFGDLRPALSSADQTTLDVHLASMSELERRATTLLDETTICWFNCHGDCNAHTNTALPNVILGGMGGYFAMGRWLQLSSTNPSKVLISLANCIDVDVPCFGEEAYRDTSPLADSIA